MATHYRNMTVQGGNNAKSLISGKKLDGWSRWENFINI